MSTVSSYVHRITDAIELIRLIEPALAAHGYHSGLTGGVLYKGTSHHDTDLIIYPHDPTKCLPASELLKLLAPFGVTHSYTTDSEYTHREILICHYQGQRIDLFLLS
jgi:hypothetical protein